MNIAEKVERKSGMSNTGWTVLEILIAVTAIAVVLVLSAPGISTMAQKYMLKKASTELLTSVELAQYEAARRRNIVTICPSSDGETCRTDGDWNRGWLLYIDGNANRAPESSEILQAVDSPGDNIRVHGFGAFAYGASFDVTGSLEGNNLPAENGFLICNASGAPGFHQVRVLGAGMIQPQKSDQDCSRS